MTQTKNVDVLLPKKPTQVNERQKALVDILISENCSIEEASKRAGYNATTAGSQASQTLKTVSYTHLTLPTKA